MNFIDQVDRFNRLRQKTPFNQTYASSNHGINTTPLLSGREKTFRNFLYYRLFYANIKPTILCEGKTDNIYLKSAITQLANKYPRLASVKTSTSEYELLIRFFEYSKRTRFLLQLYGGTSYLSYFINQFSKHYVFYKSPKPQHPVIIILDNDSGFKNIESKLKQIDSAIVYPTSSKKHDYKNAEFIHVIHNLYVVLTPLNLTSDTDIESLFDDATRLMQHKGKCFNTAANRDEKIDLSKDAFAKHIINAQKKTINFDGPKPLLGRIVAAITHYDSIK